MAFSTLTPPPTLIRVQPRSPRRSSLWPPRMRFVLRTEASSAPARNFTRISPFTNDPDDLWPDTEIDAKATKAISSAENPVGIIWNRKRNRREEPPEKDVKPDKLYV